MAQKWYNHHQGLNTDTKYAYEFIPIDALQSDWSYALKLVCCSNGGSCYEVIIKKIHQSKKRTLFIVLNGI